MKPKTKIDITDKVDLEAVIYLADLLYVHFNLQSGLDLAREAEIIIYHDFCSECESHKDGCDCGYVNIDSYADSYEYGDWSDYEN